MVQEGRVYQVRAGTLTTPIVGDVLITDSAAEMCADAVAGTTIIPVAMNISVRLGTGIAHEYAAKSVATVSSAGTAFVPLNLKVGGSAATSTARAAAGIRSAPCPKRPHAASRRRCGRSRASR